jgi:Ca2+-binding RTX toxin-like protein
MCIYVGSVSQNTESDGQSTLDFVAADTVSGTYTGFYGLNGDDNLTFVAGTEVTETFMYGGEGNDTLTFSSGTTGTLSGDAGNDTISFNGSGNGTLLGGDGDDSLEGGAQNDFIDGGRGEDRVIAGNGNDQIFGGGRFDWLNGGDGKDTIEGGGGNDWIEGRAGKDLLSGGSGADTFYFLNPGDSGNTKQTRDVITDFNAGSATTTVDKINIGGIDAIEGGGFNTFTFVTNFTAAGQVRVTQSGDNTLVLLNTSGTSGAEIVIQLNNVTASNVTAADLEFFLL